MCVQECGVHSFPTYLELGQLKMEAAHNTNSFSHADACLVEFHFHVLVHHHHTHTHTMNVTGNFTVCYICACVCVCVCLFSFFLSNFILVWAPHEIMYMSKLKIINTRCELVRVCGDEDEKKRNIHEFRMIFIACK